jgi:hypothetical protein
VSLEDVRAIPDMTKVEEIAWLEREADRLGQQADDYRWRAARLIAEELDDGKTQRVLAKEIGKSQTHVSLMAQVWRDYQGNQKRSFNSIYQQAKRARPPGPWSTRAEDEEQRQASVNVHPDYWVAFKKDAKDRGTSPARLLGDFVHREVDNNPPPYPLPEPVGDPYIAEVDSCGVDTSFREVMTRIKRWITDLVHNPTLTPAQRTEVARVLRRALNELEERS